jgi:hypothetical protein
MGTAEGMPTSAQRAMNLDERSDRGGEPFYATEKREKYSGTRPFMEMDCPSGTKETNRQLTILRR